MTVSSGQEAVSSKKTGLTRMSRRVVVFFCLLPTVFLPAVSFVEAQQSGKVYRIGYLGPSTVHKGFRQRLRELGYIEGKNLVIEARLTKGKRELFPEFAAELVNLRVDLILTVGTGATRAAKQATSTIPIVMGNSSADPVRLGFVASLARPGGNVTGVVDIMAELAGKRLELLKETFPSVSRVAHLSAQGISAGAAHLEQTIAAGRSLGVRIQALEVPGPDDLESAFQAAVGEGAEALVVVGTSFFITNLQRIVNLEIENRLPAMHTHRRWVPAGGLMSYRTNNLERYRRAAAYVDRILKGTKPAALPVVRVKKFEFGINLKTAKQLGVAIPPEVLLQATKVIK